MAKNGSFPVKPFGAFTHHRRPENVPAGIFLSTVVFVDYRMKV